MPRSNKPRPEINEELCFGCMMCTIGCPRGVLIEPDIGMVPAIKTPNECTGCNRCVDTCPHDAIQIIKIIMASSH